MSEDADVPGGASAGEPAAQPMSDLGDAVIRALYAIGLRLRELLRTTDEVGAERVQALLDEVDLLIRDVHDSTYAATTVTASPIAASDADCGDARPARIHAEPPQPDAVVSPTLHRLLDQSHLLHERLHRVVVALTLTEDVVADALDAIADRKGGTDHRVRAKRARMSAAACRDFAARLETLRPDG